MGKKHIDALKEIEKGKEYILEDAIELIKKVSGVKFDATLETHFNIKYKSLQNVRGVIQLPHGTGKKVKVLVFAKGEKAEEAKNAGADYVGDDDLVEKIKSGWIDFDFVVSTPDMMKEVGKLGPILGKKGLMPKPKSGTVTMEIESIIKQLKAGRVEYRADKSGVVHMGLGKLSFETSKLAENVKFAFSTILKEKPSDAKGDYIVSSFLAGTMTPSIRLNTKELKG